MFFAATMFATQATYYTTLQAMPAQLVFGWDATLDTKFEANWNLIPEWKYKIIKENSKRENVKCVSHKYHKDDKVLFKRQEQSKFGQDPWNGPYKITKVNSNGRVHLKKGAVYEIVNI